MSPTGLTAVRELAGNTWQVLLGDQTWHTCQHELDARFIAHALQTARAIRGGAQADDETADELEDARAVVIRNIGACASEQLIHAAANQARGHRALR